MMTKQKLAMIDKIVREGLKKYPHELPWTDALRGELHALGIKGTPEVVEALTTFIAVQVTTAALLVSMKDGTRDNKEEEDSIYTGPAPSSMMV